MNKREKTKEKNNREEEIIDRIEKQSNNYYINIAKGCLEQYGKFNDFEKAVLSEVVFLIIDKHYSMEECFSNISQEYNVDCKKIVFNAIIKAIRTSTIKSKILFLIHKNEAIFQCINIIKNQVVEIAYNGKKQDKDDTIIKIEKMQEKYRKVPIIDIMKELSNKSIEVIKKLGIKLENKVYTEYEFDILEREVSDYYEYEEMEDKSYLKSLEGTGVSQEEVTEVIHEIYRISSEHNF